jgi:hypothetical protein
LKISARKILFILIIIIVLGTSFGCSPKEKPTIANPENETEEISIMPTDKATTEGLALLDYYNFDIDGDGIEETISMYVDAAQDSNGEILWDDGQKWLFLVESKDKDYVLFDDFVQLGTIKFYVYNILDEDAFYITTVKSTTADLTITEYKFDKKTKSFISKVVYNTTGNVNMLHSS